MRFSLAARTYAGRLGWLKATGGFFPIRSRQPQEGLVEKFVPDIFGRKDGAPA